MFKLLRELRSLLSSVAIIVCVCMSLLNQASQKTALVAAATTTTTTTTTTTITTATLGGNDTDYLALLSIKAQITNDPILVTSSWNNSLHFCLWEGILCGHRHQRVTGLSIEWRYLEGSISTSIGNLSFLRIVDLSNNNFQGEIPHEMDRLFRLQFLNLTHNLLEGQIPANVSSCNNLRRLSLGYNKFIGNPPIELGSLNQLVQLYMNSNSLSGAISPSFGNLSSLKLFSISENMLEGSIPDSLGSLKSLRYLSFSSNKISEYGTGSMVSTGGDVYSYGILLLELFTGKRPTDGMFKDGLTLDKLAKLALPERVMEIVDENNSRREMGRGKFLECLILILRIGVKCSVESPRERITIVDAAKALHLVKDMLLGRRISSNVQITSKG